MAAADISEYKRSTQGVRLIKMDEGVTVVSMAVTNHEEEEEEPEGEEQTSQSAETSQPLENSQPPEIVE